MTAVPVDITHSLGSLSINVNQLKNGGKWNYLGKWSFGSEALVTIRSFGPGTTCADAVKLTPTSAPSPVILDNGQPGTVSTGYWATSGAPNPYGPNSIYSKVAGATYKYTVPLPQPGAY